MSDENNKGIVLLNRKGGIALVVFGIGVFDNRFEIPKKDDLLFVELEEHEQGLLLKYSQEKSMGHDSIMSKAHFGELAAQLNYTKGGKRR